jgi:hypothetical protein
MRSLRQDVGLTMSPQKQPPKPKPVKGKSIYRGSLPDDDAIYQDGGFLWRFIMVKNLNPNIKPKKEKGPR